MNIEMINNYLKNELNSGVSNGLYPNNRLPNGEGQNNLMFLFLQKKRNLERILIHNRWKNNISPKKEVDFCIPKEQERLDDMEQIKRLIFKGKNNDIFQGYKDKIKTFSNNKGINSIIENKKINVERINSDSLHMNNYNKKNFIEDMMSQNSNEIKVMKNNKIVYANNIDSFSKINKIRTKKKLFRINKRKRGSKYRGVSKNGNQWQVLMMFQKSKSYIGTYSSEELAARVYDILVIKKKGVKAITNFNYSPQQINNILLNDIDVKAEDINDIILELLKEEKLV